MSLFLAKLLVEALSGVLSVCSRVVEILSLDSAWSHLSCIDVSEDSRQLAPAPGPDSQAGPELTLTLGAGVLTPRP